MNASSEEERRTRALAYVLQVLLEDRVPGEVVQRRLVYQASASAGPRSARLRIVPSRFFGPDYGTPASLPRVPLPTVEGTPLLYGSPEVRREGEELVVHADVVASAYFMLTRYEEMVRREVRDRHGRFPGKESLAYRAGFLDRPIVEEYARLLSKWLREVGVALPEPGRHFCPLLTHDVDQPTLYPSRLAALRVAVRALIPGHSIRKFPQAFAVACRLRRDPYDTFDELMDLDRSVAASEDEPRDAPTYFLMAGGRSEVDWESDPRSPAARDLIRRLRNAGAAIGLHASHEASLHPELIAQEKATLEDVCGRPIRRNRFHYLGGEVETCWALAKAGINWDSTLGYADVAGFRLGVCHPVPLFDPVQMRPFGIEEHPLTVMDGTLSNPDYMGLDEEQALDYCERLLRETRKHNGEFVALWHNSKLAPRPGNYHPRLYRRLLAELAGGPQERRGA